MYDYRLPFTFPRSPLSLCKDKPVWSAFSTGNQLFPHHGQPDCAMVGSVASVLGGFPTNTINGWLGVGFG